MAHTGWIVWYSGGISVGSTKELLLSSSSAPSSSSSVAHSTPLTNNDPV